jgi:hypothetical protein
MTFLFSILSDVEYETAGYTTLMESLTHEQVFISFPFFQLCYSFMSVLDLL